MKTKKITVILIAIAFAFIILLSCVGLLSIKKIEVSYAIFEQTEDAERIQSKLDAYLNKNLLLLSVDQVKNALKDEHYMEIESIRKKFPNVLSVKIQERREIYRLNDGINTYILDENGVLLNDDGTIKQGREVIDLELITFRNNPLLTSKIEIVDATLGNKLHTSNDQVFFKTLELAKNVGLGDCIKSISIEYCSGDEYDVSFETHTGVKVYVVNISEDGERKGLTGFSIYDADASDFQKRFGLIEVKYTTDGTEKLIVQHTFDEIDDINRNDVLLHSEDI